jgi:diadenosine tetraphosphatase ApaH/serine/threonine PP2A family protein phosphatase
LIIRSAIAAIVIYVWMKHDNNIHRVELAIVGTIGGRLLTDDDIFQQISPELADFDLTEEYEALNRLLGGGHIRYVIRTCNDLVGYGHTCRLYYATSITSDRSSGR